MADCLQVARCAQPQPHVLNALLLPTPTHTSKTKTNRQNELDDQSHVSLYLAKYLSKCHAIPCRAVLLLSLLFFFDIVFQSYQEYNQTPHAVISRATRTCYFQLLVTVGLLALELPPGPDGISELLKNVHGGIPVDAGISDGDTPLEAGGALLRDLLCALVQVALDHDTDDAVLSLADLVADDLGNLRLVPVVLERVAVRAVDHHDGKVTLGLKSLTGGSHAVLVEVGALGAATEDDEAVGVAAGLGDSGQALLGHTHEVVLRSSGANGVNGNSKTTVGTVLEAHRERETRSQLTVELGLGGTGTDGTERNEVCEELRRDGVQHLGGNGHALAGKVTEELAGDTETLVDLEGLIDIRVVDQALPANSCARLLEVGAHDNAQVTLELVGNLHEARAVLDSSLGVVHGAGTADHEETVIALLDDLDSLFAALENGGLGVCRGRDLRSEKLGLDERVVAED
jgi:hypothetical protein